MIIKFYNLGAIEETELDLRPLTVIIGPNNSNKTYIAYSVYGLLQQASQTLGGFPTFIHADNKGTLTLKDDDSLHRFITSACNEACERFRTNLITFFQDSSATLFKDTRFELVPTPHEITDTLKSLAAKGLNINNYRIYNTSFGDDVLRFTRIDTNIVEPNAVDDHIAIAITIIEDLFERQYCLPAERNSFVITYKMLLNKRFSLLRDRERQIFGKRGDEELQRRMLREQGDIRYPQPIEDFLDFLSEVELSHGQRGTAKSGHSNGQQDSAGAIPFAAVASQIEKYIQDGNQTAFIPTTLGGSEIMVNVKKGLSIDLYNASSSIKQLAPLLLYLRYRAAENQLLIIDEPEMNLHPESQVRLLEILAILVNAGVKVLLTTHSPYLMSHLNNLTLNENHSDAIKKKQATSLYLKDARAFLTMDQVSAYEMKHNQLQSLKNEDFGIRYDTFSNVSVDVQQKYFEIYEKGKPTKRGKAQTTRNGDIS